MSGNHTRNSKASTVATLINKAVQERIAAVEPEIVEHVIEQLKATLPSFDLDQESKVKVRSKAFNGLAGP